MCILIICSLLTFALRTDSFPTWITCRQRGVIWCPFTSTVHKLYIYIYEKETPVEMNGSGKQFRAYI